MKIHSKRKLRRTTSGWSPWYANGPPVCPEEWCWLTSFCILPTKNIIQAHMTDMIGSEFYVVLMHRKYNLLQWFVWAKQLDSGMFFHAHPSCEWRARPTAPRYLDQLLDGTLLCRPGIAKLVQASEEASRAKKLMGALRYLYRNSA